MLFQFSKIAQLKNIDQAVSYKNLMKQCLFQTKPSLNTQHLMHEKLRNLTYNQIWTIALQWTVYMTMKKNQ